MIRRTLAAVAVAAMCTTVALAGDEDKEPKLSIGDDAPALEISHWVKGDAVESFEEGKVYVVEFWATWCGPCRMSMPHLSSLQEKYADYDVTVVSVSDEPLATVVDFLFKTDKSDGKINQERTNYTLTTDPDRSVMNAYHKAAGQRGIPSAFIVGKDTKVEWIGHPMTMDEPLDAIVRDTWDRDAFKNEFETARANEAKASAIGAAVQAALRDEDYATAVDKLDELIALGASYQRHLADKFEFQARELKDLDAAYETAASAMEPLWDDSMSLNRIAWFIVDEPNLDRRDLELAMKAASRANELTEGKSAAILDTVARVHFEKGDIDKAVIIQRKAVKNAEGPMADELQKALDRYEEASNKY